MLLLCLVGPPCLAQADYAREQRWADEITPAILVGDPVQLALPAGRKFLAIYAPNTKAQAGVIVVHGLGVHPDWGLINPLRSQLAEQGYATLSVQMPVLAAEEPGGKYPPLFPEAAERLAVAVEYLRSKGHQKIAIVSHSLGSRMTNVFLNQPNAPAISAWVAIGISGEYTDPATFKAPVLDLYGEKDLPGGARPRSKARRGDTAACAAPHRSASPAPTIFLTAWTNELVRDVKLFLDRTTR